MSALFSELNPKLENNALYECLGQTTEEQPLSLRMRPLVIEALVCQCFSIACIAREWKAITLLWKSNPGVAAKAYRELAQRPAAKVQVREPDPEQLRVGIMGGGWVGSLLAHRLLDSGKFHPSSLVISTRQPQLLGKLKQAGVQICFDNKYVVQNCELIFVACLPAHLKAVSSEVRGQVAPFAIVVSACVAVLQAKVVSHFDHPYCVTTNLRARSVIEGLSYEAVEDVLENHSVEAQRELTKITAPSWGPGEDFYDQMLYAFADTLYQRQVPLPSALVIALALISNGVLIYSPEDAKAVFGGKSRATGSAGGEADNDSLMVSRQSSARTVDVDLVNTGALPPQRLKDVFSVDFLCRRVITESEDDLLGLMADCYVELIQKYLKRTPNPQK